MPIHERMAAAVASATAKIRTIGDTGQINIGGLDWSYWHLPAGPNTIVFIHGNSAGKEVFYKQFEALSSSGYSLLAIDILGHGSSSNATQPDEEYNTPAFALNLYRLLASLKISRPVIFGWSMGGHIAIEMAGRGFDLAGLMISGTPPFGPSIVDFERAFKKSAAMEVTLKPERTAEDMEVYRKGLFGTFANRPEAFDLLVERADGRCPERSFAHWATGEEGCHQRTVVCGWDRPICVLHGNNDVFVSDEYLKTFPEERFWQSRIIRMEDIGHAPFLEQPETFNTFLLEFCADCFDSLPTP